MDFETLDNEPVTVRDRDKPFARGYQVYVLDGDSIGCRDTAALGQRV